MPASDFNQNDAEFPGRAPANECPSLMDLAAYLDGGMPDESAVAMQAHIDACASCRHAIDDARAMQTAGAAMTYVPPRVLAAAMALVPDDAVELLHASNAKLVAARPGKWRVLRRSLGRGLAAAAAIAICAGGYHIGLTIASPVPADASLDAEMTFGLLDGAMQSEGELDFLSFAPMEQS